MMSKQKTIISTDNVQRMFLLLSKAGVIFFVNDDDNAVEIYLTTTAPLRTVTFTSSDLRHLCSSVISPKDASDKLLVQLSLIDFMFFGCECSLELRYDPEEGFSFDQPTTIPKSSATLPKIDKGFIERVFGPNSVVIENQMYIINNSLAFSQTEIEYFFQMAKLSEDKLKIPFIGVCNELLLNISDVEGFGYDDEEDEDGVCLHATKTLIRNTTCNVVISKILQKELMAFSWREEFLGHLPLILSCFEKFKDVLVNKLKQKNYRTEGANLILDFGRKTITIPMFSLFVGLYTNSFDFDQLTIKTQNPTSLKASTLSLSGFLALFKKLLKTRVSRKIKTPEYILTQNQVRGLCKCVLFNTVIGDRYFGRTDWRWS